MSHFLRPVGQFLVILGVIFLIYLYTSKIFGFGLMVGANSVVCGG